MQYQVNENFNLQVFVDSLAKLYQAKGFFVNVMPSGNNVMMRIEKNNSGINTVVGLCEGITLNLSLNASTFTIVMSDGAWTDKIIGFFIGWFICGITWITTGVGAYRQSQLVSNLKTDIFMTLSNSGATSGPYPFT